MAFNIRKIPVLKRVVPSIQKRVKRFMPKPHRPGRVSLTGIGAPLQIFGDSHGGLYNDMPGIQVHYVGPLTMHRIGRDGLKTFEFNQYAIRPGDALGFVFGEIDARVHIARQRDEKNRNPDEIIETLTENYINTLTSLRQQFVGSKIVVFSAVPTAGLKYPNYDERMPRKGTDAERVQWTVKINDAVRRKALSRGLGYVDQCTPFANKLGLLDRRMTEDGGHVSPALPHDVDLVCVFAKE